MRKAPTDTEIAADYRLWQEYIDIDGHDTLEWFEATSVADKVEIIQSMFGKSN